MQDFLHLPISVLTAVAHAGALAVATSNHL